MSYEDAAATKMLATKCCVCNKPLLDSISVEVGMGPVCRKRFFSDHSNPNQGEANKIVHHCATSMAHPYIIDVNCKKLDDLGFEKLSDRIRRRMNLKSRIPIVIKRYRRLEVDGAIIFSPFKRKSLAAWKSIYGRVWMSEREANFVPDYSMNSVIELLEQHYSGYILAGDYFDKGFDESPF